MNTKSSRETPNPQARAARMPPRALYAPFRGNYGHITHYLLVTLQVMIPFK